ELRVGARLLEHVAEPVHGPAPALHVHARAAERAWIGALPPRRRDRLALGAARCELLADHPQRQELVALEPEDRAQALDVDGRVEPVAALGAARGEELLVLEIADLRDRDVGELALELLADGADRERL